MEIQRVVDTTRNRQLCKLPAKFDPFFASRSRCLITLKSVMLKMLTFSQRDCVVTPLTLCFLSVHPFMPELLFIHPPWSPPPDPFKLCKNYHQFQVRYNLRVFSLPFFTQELLPHKNVPFHRYFFSSWLFLYSPKTAKTWCNLRLPIHTRERGKICRIYLSSWIERKRREGYR